MQVWTLQGMETQGHREFLFLSVALKLHRVSRVPTEDDRTPSIQIGQQFSDGQTARTNYVEKKRLSTFNRSNGLKDRWTMSAHFSRILVSLRRLSLKHCLLHQIWSRPDQITADQY